jgi:hypothetical protein
VQSLPSGVAFVGPCDALEMNRGNELQVTDQPRDSPLARRHETDDSSVVRLAIEVLRVWRFSVLFDGDTLGTQVAFDPWSRVCGAAPNRLIIVADPTG